MELLRRKGKPMIEPVKDSWCLDCQEQTTPCEDHIIAALVSDYESRYGSVPIYGLPTIVCKMLKSYRRKQLGKLTHTIG